MSVTGISNPLTASLASIGRPQTPAGRVEQGQAGYARPVVTTPTPAQLKPQAPIAGSSAALSAAAPAGTDPELWSVLTAEERTFFAKASALGPLTYGRISTAPAQPAPAAARGGRLDVRA